MGESQWQSVVKYNATMGYSLKSNMTVQIKTNFSTEGVIL